MSSPEEILVGNLVEAIRQLQHFIVVGLGTSISALALTGARAPRKQHGGDFNGDGFTDFAVSVFRVLQDLPAIFVYYGGPGVDGQPDAFLFATPEAFGREDDSIWTTSPFAASGLLHEGHLKFVPDMDNDGDDELLITSGKENTNATDDWYLSLTNAVVYKGTVNSEVQPDMVLVAPNQSAPFADYFRSNSAVGDFTGDGVVDVIISQERDNNDAATSSRVYRFEVEDQTVDVATGDKLPQKFSLQQNYPNPFNPNTTISYELPVFTSVKIEVYNLRGQRVVELVNERQGAGTHKIAFDAGTWPAGVYVYRISAGEFTQSRKMVLVK